MSVVDDAIVESSDTRPFVNSPEESEERRRMWWTLYIWDRHLALRYNSPLSIKDAESQDILLPADDDVWVSSNSPSPRFDTIGNSRGSGPPSSITGNSIFGILVPMMCIVGRIIDMHHVRRVERSSSNLVADAYIATITQQLNELAPSIAALESNTTSGSARSQDAIQHHHLLSCYARFLLHLLYALLEGSWDKLILFERGHESMQSVRFHETLQRSLAAADCVNDTLHLNPDLGFKAMVSIESTLNDTWTDQTME